MRDKEKETGIFMRSRGFFLITDDFDYQRISLSAALHRALKGEIGLDVELTSGHLHYSKRQLQRVGNPFFCVSMLLPWNAFYVRCYLHFLKNTAGG